MTQRNNRRQHFRPLIQTPPARFERIIDSVRESDRLYFMLHPDEKTRERPFIPGESWPYRVLSCDSVLVRRVAPGIRKVEPLIPGGSTLVWAQIDLPCQEVR